VRITEAGQREFRKCHVQLFLRAAGALRLLDGSEGLQAVGLQALRPIQQLRKPRSGEEAEQLAHRVKKVPELRKKKDAF
jgi:predicted ArsR family transcriptional regulator